MASSKTERSGIAVGPNKGHKTEQRVIKPRISRTKGKASKRTQFVREIVKEVSGLAPYERRVIELLRNSKDKRARKLAKKRVSWYFRTRQGEGRGAHQRDRRVEKSWSLNVSPRSLKTPYPLAYTIPSFKNFDIPLPYGGYGYRMDGWRCMNGCKGFAGRIFMDGAYHCLLDSSWSRPPWFWTSENEKKIKQYLHFHNITCLDNLPVRSARRGNAKVVI
ncbi:hypothetical protein VTL71DRAFT_12179 [Oculimacula yallundae]|uniref:60S ribosomal protein L36 n=1 Tax=Oculimacula yallundae TaxID=86028 RepID=A0ABR4CS97_9HELO